MEVLVLAVLGLSAGGLLFVLTGILLKRLLRAKSRTKNSVASDMVMIEFEDRPVDPFNRPWSAHGDLMPLPLQPILLAMPAGASKSAPFIQVSGPTSKIYDPELIKAASNSHHGTKRIAIVDEEYI